MKIKNHRAVLLDGLRMLDGLALLVTGWLAFVWRFQPLGSLEQTPDLMSELLVGGALAGLLGATLMVRDWHHGGLWASVRDAVKAWMVTWMLLLAWLVFTKQAGETSRLWLAAWAAGSLGAMLLLRWVCLLFGRHLSRVYWRARRILVVGSVDQADALLGAIEAQVSQRLHLHRISNDQIDRLPALLHVARPDEVWLCLEARQMSTLPTLLAALADSTVDVKLIPDLQTIGLLNHGVSDLFGAPVLHLSDSPMSNLSNRALKWLEDKVLALTALVMFAPLMLLIALAIKLTSPGPVLYRQRRDGWNGQVVNVYKFRSMVVHMEAHGQLTQASRNDARVTPLGRFLRRTSLDELPQLINVLQGRMSLVGPRPHALAHNQMYRSLIPKYMLRHKVKPGITGWAQIHGLRGETDTLDKMEKRVRADLFYIENWSLALDLRILLLTVVRGFVSRNAY